MNRKLIITADDYGLCGSVNRAIEECFRAGAVRSTCVMTNMPACEDAASLRKSFPGFSVGIHWNLTQGKPLLEPRQVPTLVGENGNFQTASQLRQRWLLRRVNIAEIAHELRAQFRQFRALAGRPDFWNTHQNVHVFPGLFDLFVSMGRELGIPAMRSHRRLTIPYQGSSATHSLQHPLYWLKGLVIARWSDQAESMGVQMPDGRLYTPGYNGKGTASILKSIQRLDWHRVRKPVEIVMHPATAIEPELFGSLIDSRVMEYKALTDPALLTQLRGEGVDLVGFEALNFH